MTADWPIKFMKSFCLPFFSTFAEACTALPWKKSFVKKYSVSASAEVSYGAGLKKFLQSDKKVKQVLNNIGWSDQVDC